MKDKLLTALKIIISLALIAYLFSRVPLADVGRELASARPGYLLLALLFYLGAVTLQTIRWQLLLRSQQMEVPLRPLLRYTFVGLFFSNLLPTIVGGDVMRGYGLARYTDRTAAAAVSVLVDRIVGLLAFMSSAAVAALIAVRTTGQEELRPFAVAAVVILAAVVLGFFMMLSHRLRTWLQGIFRWKPLARLQPLYNQLSEAFDAYRHSTKSLLQAFAIALGVVLLANFVNWFLAEAVGGGISLLHIFLFNSLIALVSMIPLSIGGLGIRQNAYVFFYSMVGVPESQAAAIALLLQLITYVSSLPGGILWWRGRNRQAEAAQETAGAGEAQ